MNRYSNSSNNNDNNITNTHNSGDVFGVSDDEILIQSTEFPHKIFLYADFTINDRIKIHRLSADQLID
jgi:hypothetical protein